MKQAHEKYFSGSDYEMRKIEILPKCKKVTEFGRSTEYQLVRRKVFFGLIPWTYWVRKKDIMWYDKPTVEYYDCSCGETK